jgi:hypothetical protein
MYNRESVVVLEVVKWWQSGSEYPIVENNGGVKSMQKNYA